MAGKTISIGFKIDDGNDGLKKLVVDANELGKAMKGSLQEAKSLKKSMIDIGAVSFGIDAISGALNSLQGAMGSLIDAYNVQMEAETKLETVMRQRLGATDAQIQSIKDLCSAQQQLGVIGDEVQLAGAQQLTTFLSSQKALETLIPAMNNLVAQQKGYNATGSDAVSIGNLLGKVMQGQVNALKKVGITFTEAEKKALEFGTEEERAAVLARVVVNNVGEMNAALAATPTGQAKQIANTIGDIGEQLGGVLQGVNKFVAPLNQIVMLGGNMSKVVMGFKTFKEEVIKVTAAMTKAIAASKALRIALQGALAVGVAAAIYALCKGIQNLTGHTEETNKRLKMMADIHAEASQKAEEQKVKIDLLVKAAKNEKLSLDERQSAIKQLNSVIPDYNGQLDETTGKYKENKAALDDYLRSLVRQYEIEGAQEKLKEIGRRKADARIERKNAIKEHETVKATVSKRENQTATASPAVRAMTSSVNDNVGSATLDASRLNASYDRIVDATKKFNDAVAEERMVMSAYGLDLQKEAVKTSANAEDLKKDTGKKKGSSTHAHEEILPEGSIADYQKKISELNKQISLSIDPASIAAMTEQVKDLELKIWDLKVRARIEGGRDSFDTMVSNIEAMPITVDVKVNPKLEGLKNLKLGTAKWYQDIIDSQNASKKLAQQLSGVAEVGRAASSAFSAMGEAMESPALNIAAIIAGAIANVMAGYAQATAKAGSTAVSPWEWAAFAISGLATAIATVSQIKQVTAFADGGVVSGPTMALVGEYAGARNNPEVIAPLNKLRDLLPEPGAGVQRVEVTGRLRGADLVLASSNYNNISKRSRH